MDNPQLRLENIRQTLARIEETVLFALLERAQFRQNPRVYRIGEFPALAPHDNLCGHLLHETERVHARMRRYTSPDEHPFYAPLPAPLLPAPREAICALVPNTLNINHRILYDYVSQVVPSLCAAGDDQHYGSSAVCDVQCLQSISRRIHYGKFVAESKYRESPERFRRCAESDDDALLLEAVTHADVEQSVLSRVREKTQTFLAVMTAKDPTPPSPDLFVALYRDWMIPLNKRVQVAYLRLRISQTKPVPVRAD